jgi:nitrite reductase/ring-hydroxylating ferredoxin subunit
MSQKSMAIYALNLNRKSLREDKPVGAVVQGKKIAIVLHKGNVYAINSVCNHMGGPLDKGHVEGDEIICPWHAGAYSIITGKADEKTKWVHDTNIYKIAEDKSGDLSVDV